MLLQASAVVQTQLDAGSADRVPSVLAELRNITAGGQLKASACHLYLLCME